ncbi:vWA domain-containing protein [Streptomyces sp. 5-10]|uniref:vWA domain-containing protein n=1 Tax=Streptomyces sp. 5-10 TaxID=878925 RepID=UPI00168B2846|nr:vWA domain-containing protein [Streptomyces sp. 5-10]MBD3004736.1 VWA domain-containing protein [Streptomyces sp. 5-10]
MKLKQNLINHVALVLDASASMRHLSHKVIEVADEQITYLARRSKELDQETRVTVYVFADEVDCVIYDKDVLRMPSLKQLYRTGGMTSLVAATLKSQRELAQTAQLYGDHSFLTFVLTDGQENASHRCPDAPSRYPNQLMGMLSERLQTLPDNYTVAVLVPDQVGKREAQQFGFPKDNIAIWDATSTTGLEEAGQTIHRATETFMTNRASGIRGSRSVFSMDSSAVNKDTVRAAGLKELPVSSYQIVRVAPGDPEKWPKIREWVQEGVGHPFRTGMVHQELVKTTEVQSTKSLVIVDNETDRAYGGTRDQVRSLLGLGGDNVKISPQSNKKYSVFVESRSTNRKPVVGQRMLLMF